MTLRRKHARLEFIASRRDGKFRAAKKLRKNEDAREIHEMLVISSGVNLVQHDENKIA